MHTKLCSNPPEVYGGPVSLLDVNTHQEIRTEQAFWMGDKLWQNCVFFLFY